MYSKESKQLSWAEWKRPLIAVALTFFCNVENSALTLGEWPYMNTIDHEATASFFGYFTSANKLAHAVSAFAFALWAHKISGIKIPMLAGRCITLIACVMYIFIEFIPYNRRWWMFVCYVLFGIGFGTSALLRSYIARVTSDENRSTAYALQNGAILLSIVVGPIAQLSFAGLPYPGVDLIAPHIKLNIFTVSIWFSVITNIAAIIFILFLLEDTRMEEVEMEHENCSSKFSLASIKNQLSRIRSLNLPWFLVILVIAEKLVSGLYSGTLGALFGPMMTSMFALSGEEIVMTSAITQIISGLLAPALSLVFFLCKLGQRVSCQVLFVFAKCIVIAGYILTYPYPFTSIPVQPFNESTRTGCNPLEYTWCHSQLVINVIPFVIGTIVIISFAGPAALLSLDTIYSKVIGTIDQNVMQSIFVVAEDVMQIVSPIYASAIFTAIGIDYIHIINGSVYILATVVWLAAWKRLQPYK